MPKSLNPSTILLVDDNQQNQYVISKILERVNLRVITASSGKEALDLSAQSPDVIILDVKLPDLSGYEVCRRIKNNPATANIPILQISASFVSNESKTQALEGGADGYLTHPIESPVLIATVNSLLRLRRSELAARLIARQWQASFDALSDAVVLFGPAAEVIQFNRAARELCAISEDANPQPCLGEFLGPALMALISQTQTEVHQEIEKDDRVLRININPVTTQDERLGSVLVVHDLTGRVRAEEALRTNDRLAATGKLAHTIAHEINNPLEAVTNLIYLAESAAVKNEVKDYLKLASAELTRIARITKQVLTFNRETNAPVKVDVATLISEALVLYTLPIAAKSIQLVYHPVGRYMVEGFPGELRQLFSNLISNAVHILENNGRVTVNLKRVHGIHGERVQVTIHDNGPGIPTPIHEKVYDPFFTTKELKGSGLGLWIARSIAVKHRGTLRFRSRVGGPAHGTSFRITLPLVPDPLASVASPSATLRKAVR